LRSNLPDLVDLMDSVPMPSVTPARAGAAA
jgi:hypothetical protein